MKDEPAEAAPKPIPSVARDASYLTRSAVGRKRRFDPLPATSGLSRSADINRPARLVRCQGADIVWYFW